MLRLSKKADYALIAMNHLARKPAGPAVSISARDIAERYDIPLELMAKVLQRLVRTGLLVSTQGTRGGYMLSRPPGSISVADVIQAIDGPFTVTACSTERHDCEQYSKCNVRGPLWQIRERIVATLGTVSIAEMAAEPESAPAAAELAVVRRSGVSASAAQGPRQG
jgi:Rrf2 family protein